MKAFIAITIVIMSLLAVNAIDINFGYASKYNVGRGVCGINSQNSDYVIAISKRFMRPEMQGALCGSHIYVEGTLGGYVTARVVDVCADCKDYDIKLSPGAYARFAKDPQGNLEVSWRWVH